MIAPKDHRADECLEVVDLVPGELLGESVVEERHDTVSVEQVVARMGIAVEDTHPVDPSEGVSIDGLRDQVLLLLIHSSISLQRAASTKSVVSTRDVDSSGWTSGTRMVGWPR